MPWSSKITHRSQNDPKTKRGSVFTTVKTSSYFIDWGTGGSALPAFASLSTADQIRMLELIHDASLKEGILFVYPIHGGITRGSLYYVFHGTIYDAETAGTYNTILNMTRSIANFHNTTLIASSTIMPAITSSSTIHIESEPIRTALPEPFGITLLLGAIIATVVCLVVIISRRQRVRSQLVSWQS